MKIPVLIVGCLLGLATAATGAWAMNRELQPFFVGQTGLDRIINMVDPSAVSGLSVSSQNEALLDCADTLKALNSLVIMYRSDDDRAVLAPNCLKLADAIGAKSPSNSYAWQVGAMAAAQQQDWAGMNERLSLSQRTGKTEQWVAELRVTLAESNYDRLDAATLVGNDSDLRMLVASTRGIRAIAFHYVDDASFRARIVDLVETLPAADQQRFVSTVRRFAVARRQN